MQGYFYHQFKDFQPKHLMSLLKVFILNNGFHLSKDRMMQESFKISRIFLLQMWLYHSWWTKTCKQALAIFSGKCFEDQTFLRADSWCLQRVCCKGDNIRGVIIFLEIRMMIISNSTGTCECCFFTCMM